MGRLRDLLRAVQRLAIEGANEGSKITMPPHAAEAAARFVERGGDPAHEHAAIPPPADVAGEAADEAVEVLDRVRRAQGAVERTGDAEALEREHFVQSFSQGGGGAWMAASEAGSE